MSSNGKVVGKDDLFNVIRKMKAEIDKLTTANQTLEEQLSKSERIANEQRDALQNQLDSLKGSKQSELDDVTQKNAALQIKLDEAHANEQELEILLESTRSAVASAESENEALHVNAIAMEETAKGLRLMVDEAREATRQTAFDLGNARSEIDTIAHAQDENTKTEILDLNRSVATLTAELEQATEMNSTAAIATASSDESESIIAELSNKQRQLRDELEHTKLDAAAAAEAHTTATEANRVLVEKVQKLMTELKQTKQELAESVQTQLTKTNEQELLTNQIREELKLVKSETASHDSESQQLIQQLEEELKQVELDRKKADAEHMIELQRLKEESESYLAAALDRQLVKLTAETKQQRLDEARAKTIAESQESEPQMNTELLVARESLAAAENIAAVSVVKITELEQQLQSALEAVETKTETYMTRQTELESSKTEFENELILVREKEATSAIKVRELEQQLQDALSAVDNSTESSTARVVELENVKSELEKKLQSVSESERKLVEEQDAAFATAASAQEQVEVLQAELEVAQALTATAAKQANRGASDGAHTQVEQEWEDKQKAMAQEHEALVVDLQGALDAAEERNKKATQAMTSAERSMTSAQHERDELATTNAQLHEQVIQLQESMEEKLRAAQVFVTDQVTQTKLNAAEQQEKAIEQALSKAVELERKNHVEEQTRLVDALTQAEEEKARLSEEMGVVLLRCESLERDVKSKADEIGRCEMEIEKLEERLREMTLALERMTSEQEARTKAREEAEEEAKRQDDQASQDNLAEARQLVDTMLNRLVSTEAQLAEQVNRTNSALDEFDKANGALTAAQMEGAVAQERARTAEKHWEEARTLMDDMQAHAHKIQVALDASETKLDSFRQGIVSEWQEQDASDPLPDFGLDSPVVQHLFSTWTNDQAKSKYLQTWCKDVLDGKASGAAVLATASTSTSSANSSGSREEESKSARTLGWRGKKKKEASPVEPEFARGLEIFKLAPDVCDGFIKLVIPLLRARRDTKITVLKRDCPQIHSDLRIRVDPVQSSDVQV